MKEPIHRHVFIFNENRSLHEQIILETCWYSGPRENISYTTQKLTMNSHSGCATFDLPPIFSIKNLKLLIEELQEENSAAEVIGKLKS